MNCKLTILDPTLKYWLGASTFDSFKEFKEAVKSAIIDGLIPVGNELKKIKDGVVEIETNGEVHSLNVKSTNALIDLVLKGTLQSNNEEEHFGEFLNSFEQIYAKYNSRGVIPNEEKNTDKEYLESLISFFDDYPVSEDFKVGDTYQKYSDLRGTILNTKNSIEEELKGEPEFQTDESLLKDEEAKEFYEYTLAAFYTPSDKPVVELNDDLSLLRHNVSREIARQIEGGEEFYISFAKDNSQNVQSKDWETYSVSEEFQAKGFGVVGYLYKMVAGEPKRVYIQSFEDKFNGNVTLTTDPKKAIAIGLNKAKGFTYTLPDFSSERYNKVNPDVRDELVQFRNDVRDSGTESPLFKIRGTVEEYPFAFRQNITYEKRKITASTFLQGKSKSALRLSTKEDKIVHAGNAFLLIGTNKVPLDRLALNEQWRNRVESLLTFDLYTEAEAERVVDYLNKLLDFNGGDIKFVARGNAIVAQRKSVLTMIDGKKKFTRLEQPQDIEGSTVLETLEYARINVHKDWLDSNVSRFPFIRIKELKRELKDIFFDPVDFYLEHHATVYRQMNVKGDIVYDPILSPIFDIKTKGEQIGDKIEEFQNNPTIGDFEVTVDGEYPLLDVLKELPSIINKSNDKDTLTLIGALIENPEVKSKLEGVRIKFSGRDIQGTADKDLIEIGFNQLVNPTKAGEILAHEIIHVLTSDWILFNPEHELVKEFDALIEKVPESVNKILAKAGYPKGHPLYKFEVLARLSDPKVAEALKKVKSKKKNLLEDLLDLVKSILEKVFPDLKNVKGSLYTDLLESLVKIATNKDIGVKKSLPADPFDDIDAFFKDTPDDLKPLSYGYTADDISKLEDQGYSQVFLEKSVKRIDAQLTQFIYNKGLLEHLLSGNLGFDSTFENFYYSLKPRVEFLRDTKDSSFDLEKEYFRFLLKNKDFIKDYWISKTSLAKLRKPKKGDTNKVLEIDTDLTDVNLPNDPTEVLENENADKEQQLAEIMGAEEVVEKVNDFDRSGTEHSSLENADKEAIAFVKILPKIQRDEKGTVLYDSPEGDPNLFVRVGTQYIKFETDEANQLILNDYTVTWNLIANQLTNKLSLEEMLDSIDQNPNLIHTVPEIFVLRQRLSTDIKNNFQLNLNSKVERSFKTASVPVLVLLEQEDGRMNFIDEANDLISVGGKKIDSGFLSFINRLDEENKDNEDYKSFYDREEDEINMLALLTSPKKNGGLGLEDAANMDKVFLTSLLGFNFHPYTLIQEGTNDTKREVVREFEEYLYKMLIEAEKVPIGISNFIVKGDRAKGVEGQNNRLKKVLEIENEIRPLNVSMMVQNAEGELQSTLSQFNSILQYRKHYNDAKSIEELNGLVERTKNDMFEYSLTRELLFAEDLVNGEMVEKRTNVKVEVGNLNGWKKVGKGRASQGKLTIDLDGSDWLMLNFKAMVTKGDGFIENTRAETASTSYYFKLSQWGDNRDNYVPLSHSQINSQWNKKENKFDISAGSALYKIWENYLKGETSRIKKQNLPVPKWGLFNDILNTEEKTQLLEQITPEVLIPALNRFFTAEYENYSNLFEVEMGGVKSIKDKDVLGTIEKVGLERLKAFVVVNTMIIHTEETILFQGDISQTPKYYKRAKGVQSTGTPMSKSPSSMKFINEELQTKSFASLLGFNFQIGKNYRSATLKDDIKQSYFYDKFKQGFKESRKLYYDQLGIEYTKKLAEKDEELLKDYLKVNIGDGGAYAHPDFYASILKLAGNFSTDQRIVHEALMLDARKNAKLYFGEELAKNINQTLTKEEESRMKEGFDLMFQGKGQLPLIKFTHRNTMSNSSSVVKPEVMDKFAIFPLYPQFVHDKEVAKELLMSIMRSETGYIKFESGTKIDTNPPFDFIKAVEDGQVDVSFGESAHELQLEYLREQIKTPEKHKGKNTFGTQVRKNILAELGKIKLQGEEKKGDFKRKWEGLIQQFSLATEKEVLGRLGIKDLNGEWDFQSIDKARVAEILLEEAEARDLPINIKIYFDKYRKGKLDNLETVYDLFESSLGSQQIQNLLASIIKKISIQKLNGSQYRQIASSIFSKKIMSNGKTRDLGFYVLESVISKSDKIIFGHPGIGKTFLRETRDDFIDVDNDYKEEHSTQQILRSHAKNTGKKEDLKAWKDYITTWWSKVKDDATKSGKQIFVSNLPILRMFPQDFDKVLTMSKETFIERAKQRNDYIPGEEGTEGWKNSLDVAIDKIDKSKVITTDKYLSDLLKSRVVPAECKIGMGGDFVNLLNLQDVSDYLNQNKIEDTQMDRLRALNKLLENDAWVENHKDVLTIASYRIPNQGHNSDEVMVIREFLPPMHAGEIVLPPEVTTQSGTDYDYDKMSAIVPKIDTQGRYIDYKNLTKEYQDLTYENFLFLKEEKKKDIFLLKEEKSFVLNKLFARLKELKGQKDKEREYKVIYDKFIEFQVYEVNYEISEREGIISDLRQENSVNTNLVNHTRDQIRRLLEYRRNLLNARKENRLEYEDFKQSFELQKQEVKQEQWEVSFNYSDSLRDKYDDLTKLNTSFYNKKDAIQNEMIKTFADILLDPVNYHKLIVPNSNAIVFDFLKKELLPKLYEKYDPNAKLSPTEIVTIKRNLRQFKAVKGKDLLGIAAVWNPFTTLIQNHDIKVQDYYVKTIGFGSDTVKVYIKPLLGSKDSSLFTKNGTNKLEIVSQLINVTVDMPTDDTFGLTALREEDFGAFIYSISLLNYNFEDAMYLFHQPIVLKFKTEVAKKVKQGTKRYKAITETIYELLEETIPINKEGNIDYTKAEKSLYANLLDSYETSLDPTKLTAVRPINEEFKVTSQQKAVLAHYIKLLDQSSHVRVAQQALNFDTSPDNNLAKTRQRQENYRDAVKSGIIPKEKIDEILNNSVISGLYVSDIMESLITEMFPILYSEENKSLFDELSKNYKQHQEVAFRKATNDFLLALVQNYGTFGGKNVTDLTIPLVEGRDKTRFVQKADELKKKFKAEGKNYRLLDILTLSVSRTTNKVNPQLILGMENHTDDKNELVEEFRELLSNKDSKKFAERLAIVGFVQSGWSKSPLYFSDLIPEEFITPIINEAVKAYQKLSDIEKIGFRKAFVENFDYYEGISLGRSKHDRNSDSYRLMDYRRGVAEKIADFKKEDAKEVRKEGNFIPSEFEGDYEVSEKQGLLYELNQTQDLHPKDKFKHSGNLQETLSKLLNIKKINKNNAYYLQTINSLIGITNRLIKLESQPVQDNTQEQLVFTKGTKGIGKEISSYQSGLEYALTNPVFTSPTGTEWKRDWTEGQSKWREYMINGIDFEGKPYKDVEEAYQKNKDKYPIGQERDAFMQSLLEIKLRTYPKLIEGIDTKGGVSYLTDSTHQPTKKNSHWETGGNNAFIELLTKAYLSVKGIQEQTNVDSITKDNVEKLNKKEAFEKMLSRKKDPETAEDWIATYFETGKVTSKSFDEHLDRNYKTERLNYIDKKGHAIDSIKEIIESDSKREIDINNIIEFIKEYKSVTNYWNAVQEKIKQDLDYYYNQDDTKSNSILKFEKLPPNSVTLGRYEIRDNKAPNSMQYDGRFAPSNMSGSSIGEILQSADTSRIKSYRIANYLLDTLYVSKGWQNSIVQDLANRGVVVKTHLLADDSESPGIMSQQGDIITINVRAIEREIENYGTVGFDTFLTDSLDEELIHLLTVKLASEEDISNIAKELSKEDRQKVTDYYFSKTNDPDETLRDRSIAMEYVRMVVQQKLFGRTTEDSKQVILGLVPTIKKLLNEVLDYLINLFEKNPQSVSTKVINSLINVIQNESLKDYTIRLEDVKRKANSVIRYTQEDIKTIQREEKTTKCSIM